MRNYYLVADVTEKGIMVINEDEFAEYATEKAKGHFYNAHLPAHIGDVPSKTIVVEVPMDDVNALRNELSRKNLVEKGIQKKSAYRKQKWAEFIEAGKIIHEEK